MSTPPVKLIIPIFEEDTIWPGEQVSVFKPNDRFIGNLGGKGPSIVFFASAVHHIIV